MNEGLTLSKRAHADALADVIAVCAARIDSALHQLLTHIRRFDEIRGWSWQNTKRCAHWLSWKIGLGLVAAREKVRVAHALGRLPVTVFVDAHHIEHWAQGGETKIDNLVLVCSQHHVALHEGGFQIERTERGGLVFRDPDGKEIEPAPRSSFLGDATASLEAEQTSVGLEIEPRTARVRRSFLRPDWDGCVRALVRRRDADKS